MNKIVRIDANKPDAEIIRRACLLLEAGELVVVPTETVCGIACDPRHLEKLYVAKKRSCNKPITRLVTSLEQIEILGSKLGKWGRVLAKKYWPGPLTLVLDTPDGITGFRVPAHEIPLALARAFGRPLALTSANKSGDVDAVSAEEAFQTLGEHVSLFIDTPLCVKKKPSTVVQCLEDEIKILREGAIPASEILNLNPKLSQHSHQIKVSN